MQKLAEIFIIFAIVTFLGGCQSSSVPALPFVIPTVSEASEVTATTESATATTAVTATGVSAFMVTATATATTVVTATATATATATPDMTLTLTATATALPLTGVPLSTPTATPAPDVTFGLLDRGLDCEMVTEIIGQLFEDTFYMSIEMIRFNTREALFDALANQTIDLTLCYLDPADRELMQGKLGHISQLGASYRGDEGGSLQIWANSAVKAKWRQNSPCVLRLFGILDMAAVEFPDQDAEMWLQTNAATVEEWTALCILE